MALDADSNPNLAISLGLARQKANSIQARPHTLGEWRTFDSGRAYVHLTIAFCVQDDLSLIACLPFDEQVLAAEANGSTLLDTNPDGPLVQAIANLATTLRQELQ